MMSQLQYLLGKLSEESSEVGQMAMKCQHFGIDEVYEIQELSNAERTHVEIDDMLAVIEVLNEKYNFGFETCPIRKQAKKDKMAKYMNYSISQGLVEHK